MTNNSRVGQRVDCDDPRGVANNLGGDGEGDGQGRACGSAQLSFSVRVPNRAPVKVGDVSGQTVYKKSSKGVSVSGKFSDPDMDTLSCTASSSNTDVVTTSVNWSTVTITGVSRGSATVTVTARDGHGGSDDLSFTVTVPNGDPACSSNVPGQTIYVGETASADLNPHCSDPDMDMLTYSAPASTNSSVVGPDIRRTNLTGRGIAKGTARVSATVSDGDGGSTTAGYSITVKCPPAAVGTIGSQSVNKKATMMVTVSGHFGNCNGDPLTYEASSSDPSKVTVSVSGSKVTLTGVSQGSATVTASDGHGGSATQSFSVTVPVPTIPTPSISSISPPQQPPDTEVTIYGSNFGSEKGSVSFGSNSVSINDISSWSNTSIRCFIPAFASAGTVDVTVTTSGGTESDDYSYTITGQSPYRSDCGEEEDCPGDDKPKDGSEEGGEAIPRSRRIRLETGDRADIFSDRGGRF